MPKKNDRPWTPEEVETVKRRWLAGDSARVIAEGLRGRTRNAVVAFVHRTGITRPGAVKEKVAAKNRQAARQRSLRRPPQTTKRVTAQTISLEPVKSLPVKPPVAAPESAPVAFADLEPQHCRYPVTAALPHKFCGAPKAHGVYCAFHYPRTLSAAA